MTDKELLKFCKEYNVALGISYDPDNDIYRLQMQKGWLQVNYLFSSVTIDTAVAWNAIVKSKLDELVKDLNSWEEAK